MGILTNPEGGGGGDLLARLGRWVDLICILAYLAGVGWLLVVLHPSFADRTYFSENALLPGLVDEQFSLSLDKSILKEFKALSAKGFPAEWLEEKLISLGLETHIQNFTVKLPIDGKEKAGKNVYAIVRAAREASTESIVMATPFRPKSSNALFLMLNLADFARRQIYWAKDIIFVMVEHEEEGMEAWLSAYHHRPVSGLKTKPLEARGGAIQAAVGLELIDGGPLTHAELKYNMGNGQLPNLDLVNLVVRMAEKEALEPTIFGREAPWNMDSGEAYRHILDTSLRGLLQQASCRGNGLHGVFGSYGIEAVTLVPYKDAKTASRQEYYVDITEIGRILEGALRSVNNLLEKLHQSFFFYVRPTPRRYVSIGSYIPAIGLMLLAPLLKACVIWAEAGSREDSGLMGLGPMICLGLLPGLFLFLLPDLFVSMGGILGSKGHSLVPSLAGTTLAFFAIPWFLQRHISSETKREDEPSLPLLRALSLIAFALLTGVVSVLNFGLGYLSGLVWIPVVLTAGPSNSRVRRFLSSVALFLINPVVFILLFHFIVVVADSNSHSFLDLTKDTLRQSRSWVMASLRSYYLHNSWLFPYTALGLVPLWVQFWTLAQQRPRQTE